VQNRNRLIATGLGALTLATNTPGRQLDFLEARHRAHARVEDRILLQGSQALLHDVARTG